MHADAELGHVVQKDMCRNHEEHLSKLPWRVFDRIRLREMTQWIEGMIGGMPVWSYIGNRIRWSDEIMYKG